MSDLLYQEWVGRAQILFSADRSVQAKARLAAHARLESSGSSEDQSADPPGYGRKKLLRFGLSSDKSLQGSSIRPPAEFPVAHPSAVL